MNEARFLGGRVICVDRFWSYVDMSGGQSACWTWKAYKDPNGYGRFGVGRHRDRNVRSACSHRVAFALHYGYEPEFVCHKCDNPPCCNPLHLFGGSVQDNMADMKAKGRHAFGEKHGRSVIDADVVNSIFHLRESGLSHSQIGREVGLSKSHTGAILRGAYWKQAGGRPQL